MTILYEPIWHLFVIYIIGFFVAAFTCSIVWEVDFRSGDDTGMAIAISIFWPVVVVFAIPFCLFAIVTGLGSRLKTHLTNRKQAKLAADEVKQYEKRQKEREEQLNALNSRRDNELTWD